MPELPEVETVKNELEPHVTGRSISHIALLWEGILRQPSPAEFHRRTAGQRVAGLYRRGKYLVWELADEAFLIMHLRMTGTLLYDPPEGTPYERVRFVLDPGQLANVLGAEAQKSLMDGARFGLDLHDRLAGKCVGGNEPC